jgi:hypothetical protein
MNDKLDSIIHRNNIDDDKSLTDYIPHLCVIAMVGMSLMMVLSDTKVDDRIRYVDIDTKKEVDPSLLHEYDIVDLTSTIDKPSNNPK